MGILMTASVTLTFRRHMRILFPVALALVGAVRLTAQDSLHAAPRSPSVDDPPYRQPTTALVLAVLPGAGHMYAGEYLKGVWFYFGTVSGIGGGILVYSMNRCSFDFSGTCDPDPEWPHQLLGIAGIGMGVGIWVYNLVDAPRAARRASERHRRERVSVVPVVRERVGPRTGMDLGLAVAW